MPEENTQVVARIHKDYTEATVSVGAVDHSVSVATTTYAVLQQDEPVASAVGTAARLEFLDVAALRRAIDELDDTMRAVERDPNY